ncbi:MAG: DNA translocase FtsK, partial [Patescibacteria group bacterium]
HGLINYLRSTGAQPEYQEDITSKFHSTKVSSKLDTSIGSADPLIDRAIEVIKEYDRASASVLQRRLSIGYSRAARIIDTLFELGIVGPSDGSKPRDVNMMAAQEYLESKQIEG